ncbi:Vicilin-like seed storage protein At2g28490 [Linum grandiflorum]
MSAQRDGPIVFLDDASLSPQPRTRTSVWSEFLRLKPHDRLRHLRQMFDFTTDESSSSSWKETLYSFRRWGTSTSTGKSPDSYNLYSKKADFSNSYGWSKALDEAEYSPLKQSGIGVFLVNLTAGSMMAPHVNPTATEYGVVLRGEGSVEIVYPNGTQAIKTEVAEGDVFLAPRYFPFSQMASRTGPMEFFGFTTSARKNRPLFLVGRGSVVETMKGAELPAGFGMAGDEKLFRGIAEAQRESVILPSASASPPYVATE